MPRPEYLVVLATGEIHFLWVLAVIALAVLVGVTAYVTAIWVRRRKQTRIVRTIPGAPLPMCDYCRGWIVGMYIGGEGFTSGHVSLLAQLPYLQTLQLDFTGLTDDDLVALSRLEHLRVLWLSSDRIGDRGVRNLLQLHTLEFVSLDLPPVDVESIVALGALPSLFEIVLTPRVVEHEALSRAQARLSTCRITVEHVYMPEV
jgi:hypothetical protein